MSHMKWKQLFVNVFFYEKLKRKPGGEIHVDMLLNIYITYIFCYNILLTSSSLDGYSTMILVVEMSACLTRAVDSYPWRSHSRIVSLLSVHKQCLPEALINIMNYFPALNDGQPIQANNDGSRSQAKYRAVYFFWVQLCDPTWSLVGLNYVPEQIMV